MPFLNWPAQEALHVIVNELVGPLSLRRVEFNRNRVDKAFIFEAPDSRQLALVLGDHEGNGKFSAGQSQIVLERARCPGVRLDHPDIVFKKSEAQLKSSAFNVSESRLKQQQQQLVLVGSRDALEHLLCWYCEKPAESSSMETFKNTSNLIAPVEHALNTILFGPPGTGKTHATIEHALLILEPEFVAANVSLPSDDLKTRREKRQTLKRRFDTLLKDGHVRFITFHQSFSYEDFVEGIRAVPGTEQGSLQYSVVDGVFKTLCDTASVRVVEPEPAVEPIATHGRNIWKMSLGNIGIADEADVFNTCMEQGCALLGWGANINFSGCKNKKDVLERFKESNTPRKSDDYEVTAITAFVTKMKRGDLIVATEGLYKYRAIGVVDGDYEHIPGQEDFDQRRKVRWLRRYEPSQPHKTLMHKQFSMPTLYQLRAGSIDIEKLDALLSEKPSETKVEFSSVNPVSPRVLIIDEINRGNVSRIFGELLTLIEPSKRIGAPEELRVTLPYSQDDDFGVPGNVYLIGTMNTADRSLAGLDIALRRRFHFEEMPPRPEWLDAVDVEGVNLGALLRVMNERIEVLLDREHRLGHAYFMPLADLDAGQRLPALTEVFRRQVLPLLEEYFFEDWERIRWVLNDHRKPLPAHQFVRRPNGEARDLGKLFGPVADQLQDRRWTLNEAAFRDIASYRQIVQADA